MAGAVSQAGGSASDVVPIIVVLRYMEVARVLRSVIVAVSDQGRFPVVVQICV